MQGIKNSTIRPVIVLGDDDGGLLNRAAASIGEAGFECQTICFNRDASDARRLTEGITTARETNGALAVDWSAIKKNNDLLQLVREATKPGRPIRVILMSFMKPDTVRDEAKLQGIPESTPIVEKPFRWTDVFSHLAETLNEQSTALPGIRDRLSHRIVQLANRLQGDGNRRAIADLVPSNRRRRLQLLPNQSDYVVSPSDRERTNHWPEAHFSDADIALLRNAHDVVKLHRGRVPWAPDKFDWFCLVTAPLLRASAAGTNRLEQPEVLMQFAVSKPSPWQPPPSDDPIGDLMSLMLDAGFSRARYYTVAKLPDAEGTNVLQLLRTSYRLSSGAELPLSRNLDGLLEARVMQFEQASVNRGELYYVARMSGDDQLAPGSSEDAGNEFWNEQVGAANLSAWVELPIFFGHAGIGQNLLGLVVVDRLPATEQEATTTGSERIGDSMDSNPSAEQKRLCQQIEAVQQPLLEAIEAVLNAMNQASQKARVENSERRRILREALAKARDRYSREVALADACKAEARATSVLLARYDAATKSLRVTYDTDAVFSGQEFALSNNASVSKFVLVRCAHKRDLEVVANLKDIPSNEKISESDWRALPAPATERAKIYQTWLENSVGTALAFPLLTAGNTLLGVIAVRHRLPYHFSVEIINFLYTLIDTARPYLELDAERDNRDTWDGAIMHEVRSGLAHALRTVNEGIAKARSDGPTEIARESLLHDLEDIRDLSNVFLQAVGRGDEQSRQHDYVLSGLDGERWMDALLRYAKHRAARWGEDKPFVCTPLETPPSLKEPLQFIRVIRIFLDNAFRYGAAPGVVDLQFSRCDSNHRSLIATVSNEGSFSRTLLDFDFRSPTERIGLAGRALRVHLGLSLAKSLADGVSASISLNNHRGRARVQVTWPLAETIASPSTLEDRGHGGAS